MPSTAWIGWTPTTVLATTSKYAALQCHLHGISPQLGLMIPDSGAEQFQVSFLVYVASSQDGVTVEGNCYLVCLHPGVLYRLFDKLIRGLIEESLVQIVLEQVPPLRASLQKYRSRLTGNHMTCLCVNMCFSTSTRTCNKFSWRWGRQQYGKIMVKHPRSSHNRFMRPLEGCPSEARRWVETDFTIIHGFTC